MNPYPQERTITTDKHFDTFPCGENEPENLFHENSLYEQLLNCLLLNHPSVSSCMHKRENSAFLRGCYTAL